MSATGKISYCVQFLNNETASIPACQLQKICHKLVEDFELDRFKQSTVNNDRRRSKRLTKRSDSSSDETSSSESDDSDDDQQPSSFTTTRSGRIQTMPKSYQQEFHTKLNTKKDRKEKYRSVPFYSDDFIKRHSIHCFRCYKTGYPNGSRNDTFEVSCGPTRQRTRLLLCQTCSLSCHNNCLPALNDHCFDTQTSHYTCVKCKNKTFDCVGCQKNIDKTNDKVFFRCKSCFRPYHPHCINNDLYEEGDCHDCATFKDRQPQSILAQRKDSENREELLIKWKDESFRHVNWVSASWIQALYTTLYTYYKKKRDDEDSEPKKGRYFPIEWTMIERILNVEWKDKNKQQVKRVFAVFKDTDYGDAIWDEPPAEDEPELFAAYKLALERYIRATKVKPPQKMKQLIADIRRLANAEKYESHELKAQPRYIEGGVLMQHQLEALK
ncbi:hypothetical protein G6F29_009636 [Rhizopus arrhizus]|nr:hypothetical protein G6F22_012831 [Rhizopus arrhizus]KAG1418672.1 hypothetical protein G6F58_004956 [Rhizopus delemar]KAG0796483.1 hypothetical protein G6F21_001284 [Rhizopus arrhizus]KAG0818029.1 hypothetical protein G6F20_001908 [Rhizopus arrhizus]KAG0826588.1 hypothetical protein G6F19_009218 [Rhizopus arrhizus]